MEFSLVKHVTPFYDLWLSENSMVWSFRSHGGECDEAGVESFLNDLEHLVAPTKPSYDIIIDLSAGMSNFWPCAASLVSGLVRIRDKITPNLTAVISDNTAICFFVQSIIKLANTNRNYAFVSSFDEAVGAVIAAAQPGQDAMQPCIHDVSNCHT